jgi:tetratricopeptide (TPR) repeat protein
MKRFILALALALFLIPAQSRGATFYDEQLDKGIRNSEPYSYLLIREAQQDKTHARKLLQEAVRYSPDLPAAYFELSKNSFRFSLEGLFESVDYMVEGVAAYKRNFWWSYMMISSLFVSAVLSFFVSILVIIMIRLPRDMRLFSHDMAEERSNLLILPVLLLAVFGPIYLLGALLILISLYQKRPLDKLIIYCYVLFLLVSPWVFHTVSALFSAPVSGEMKAVVQVNEAKDGKYALSLLNHRNHPVELFSYALALKREGRYREAIEINDRIITMKPDPRVYNNLANCYVAIDDLEKAKNLYKKSIALKQLPSALYNLSQVYRETLDYEKGDEYFLLAQKLDGDAVSGYRAISGRSPNRFVVDETLPFAALWEYGKGKATKAVTMGLSVLPPGFMPVLGLSMGVLFFILSRRFKARAYRCSKCGKILCSHCERHVRWGRMCTQCYQSLVKLDELDAKERITKLLAVYEHRKRRRDFLKAISFILPGSSQIYAGKVLYGLLFLWPFLFFLLTPIMNSFFVLEMSNFSHLWLNLISLYLMVVIYFISNVITRRRLAKGWL